MRLGPRHPHGYTRWEVPPHPIFIARHPGIGDFYAVIDESSRSLHISRRTGRIRLLNAEAVAGTRLLGLIAGPAGCL